MVQIFSVLSGVLPLLGTLPYIRDILKHKTKPHRGSFIIWTVLGAIAFFSQMADGATWSLVLPASDTIAVGMIAALSIWFGMGGLNKRDVGGLIVAFIGLVVWYFTKQPLAALLISIGIDCVATLMTLLKTYDEPHTETFSAWLLASLGGLFALFSVGRWSFSLLIYPAYILLANGSVSVLILWRRGRVPIP